MKLQGKASVTSVAKPAWLAPCLTLLTTACQSTPPPSSTDPVPRQPQSSLAALVRALEAVDAVHDPRGYVRVRAVESDSILDRRRQQYEYARVLLDLTVYAHDTATARQVFDDLALALEDEARAAERLDVVPRHRAERVFREMNWDADGLPEDCLSYSDVVRLEIQRGRRPPLPALFEGEPVAEPASQPAGEYVRTIAETAEIAIGPVTTDLRIAHPIPSARDMRIHIRPASNDAHFTRERIGNFLSELEAKSPLARITHVEIARVPHLPYWYRADGWTFEAVLTVRVGAS